MSPWIAFGISGWIACGLVILVVRFMSRKRSNPEKQLQTTAREFAAHRRLSTNREKAHDLQMDAIRADIVDFELSGDVDDPTKVRALLDRLLSKTKKRGERG